MEGKTALRKVATVAAAVMLVTGGIVTVNPHVKQDINPVGKSEGAIATTTAVLAVTGASLVAYGVGTYVADDSGVNTTKTDARQTHTDLYYLAQSQKSNNEVVNTAYDNYLKDAEAIAKMEGKNAYIRALENGSSESVARSKAEKAVLDYYAKKQLNLIASWNATVYTADKIRSTLRQEQSLTTEILHSNQNNSINIVDINATRSVSLTNGSGATTASIVVTSSSATTNVAIDPQRGIASNDASELDGYISNRLMMEAPRSLSTDKIKYTDFREYNQLWNQIDQEAANVASEVDTFANLTYEKWDAGVINSSDLVDPYLGAREYSPKDDYQAWALSTYSSLGLNTPENLSNVGSMRVRDETTGIVYEGILMSDGNPDSGSFTTGQTYNATQMPGPQLIVTSTDRHTLDGEFTLVSATRADGTTADSLTYRNISYDTANLSELRTLNEKLKKLRAEIEALETKREGQNADGGIALPGSIGGFKIGTILLAIFGLAAAAIAVRFFDQ